MKRNLTLALILTVPSFFFLVPDADAQSVIKLGKTSIELQSPVKVEKDSALVEPQIVVREKPSWKTRRYTGIYIGTLFPVSTSAGNLPIKYGKSYILDIGLRKLWRTARNYAVGGSFQYSFYNYDTYKVAESGAFVTIPEGQVVKKQFFRTDNLSVGLVNRIYLKSYGTLIFIDFGAYGELAVSSRFKTVAFSDSGKHKDKFRDGNLFYPLQGGVQGGIGIGAFMINCRYRLTNSFNHARYANEPDRLAIGLALEFL